ncbi:MAG: hypothetical protein DSY40_01040 [Nautilia sp.]|nr:MAG: hypothetical protein DSY40_01040 [Nautilia sp.]
MGFLVETNSIKYIGIILIFFALFLIGYSEVNKIKGEDEEIHKMELHEVIIIYTFIFAMLSIIWWFLIDFLIGFIENFKELQNGKTETNI